jgi:hypothetical protein
VDPTLARQSWDGASLDEVVRAWGPPTRVDTPVPGRDSKTWISEVRHPRTSGYSGVGVGVFGGNVGIGVGTGGGGPVSEDVERCERTLIFVNERVVDQVWSGSDAYCATFRR